jgi:uncharacterized protein (DUF2062 family)
MNDFLKRRLVAPLLGLLRQGVTPGKLALSVALGACIAVVPVLGVSTVMCAALALVLRLNMPAIQAVNYLLTPVQLLLIIPLLRFGEWLAGAARHPVTLESGVELLSRGVMNAVRVLWDAIVHATLGWLVLAPCAALVLYLILEPVFRRLAPAPMVAS